MEFCSQRCTFILNFEVRPAENGGESNKNLMKIPFFLLFLQGSLILLLGTRDENIESEPTERPKFIEDMNEAELASAVRTLKL